VHSGGRRVIYDCLVLLGFRPAVFLSRILQHVTPVLQNRTFGTGISAPRFVQADVRSYHPTNSVKALKEYNAMTSNTA